MAHYTLEIIKVRRRTLSIQVHPGGRVMVRAPQWATKGYIQNVVASKNQWIQKQLAKYEKTGQRSNLELPLFLGKQYTLVQSTDYFRGIRLQGNQLLVSKYQHHGTKQLLIAWYKHQARIFLSERLAHWSKVMGVPYKTIRITSAATRWGSASGRGSVSFSWRLMLTPIPVLDYVIVHELAHLVHHNHGKQFWGLVHRFIPAYKEQKEWLKLYGSALIRQ